MLVNRRSFLKVIGGLAAVVTLPNNIPSGLSVTPVQATIPTVQEVVAQAKETVKPASMVAQTESKHHTTRRMWCIDPVIYINGKKLLSYQTMCTLQWCNSTVPSAWAMYDPEAELFVEGLVYDDTAKESIFDNSWKTPIDVRIYLDSGLIFEGKGAIDEYSSADGQLKTYHMTILMWDVVKILDGNPLVSLG